jgi:methylase of polypeptide subunit release factors
MMLASTIEMSSREIAAFSPVLTTDSDIRTVLRNRYTKGKGLVNEVEQELGLKIVDKLDADGVRPATFQMNGLDWDLVEDVFPPYYAPGSDLFGEWLPYHEFDSLLEMGCGVGIVAVTAAMRGCPRVVAIDINPAAVENVQRNAKRHGVQDRVKALRSDMFEKVAAGDTFDALFWNLPFLDSSPETAALSGIHAALFDPEYSLLRRFLRDSGRHLSADGRIFISFSDAMGQRSLLETLAGEHGYATRTYECAEFTETPGALADVFDNVEDENGQPMVFDMQMVELRRVGTRAA